MKKQGVMVKHAKENFGGSGFESQLLFIFANFTRCIMEKMGIYIIRIFFNFLKEQIRMKIYVLEFETCEEYDGYHNQDDTTYILGTYSNKELALDAAKELLIKSVHTLRNNLLAEANYVKTPYNEKATYFEEPNFIDKAYLKNMDVAKTIDNSINELRTEGTAYLDYLQVERYFKDEIISLHLYEMDFDEPARCIIEPFND